MDLPFAITTSNLPRWNLTLRDKESGLVPPRTIAFKDEESLLQHYGFLVCCFNPHASNDTVIAELQRVKDSGETWYKRDFGKFEVELERLPF